MSKIRLIICDWGEVCGFFDLSVMDNFLRENNFDPALVSAFFKKNKADYDVGNISEDDFWEGIAKSIDFSDNIKLLKIYCQKNLRLNLVLLQYIKKLKEKYPLVLLSNIDPTTYDGICQELDLQDYFDSQFLSFRLKKNKMHTEVLNEIVSQYGVKPSECLFIDDYQGNVDKGNQFGFHSIRFINNDETIKMIDEHLH